jgi:hypothetical protein
MRGLSAPLPRSPSGVVLVIGACGPPEEIDRRREEVAEALKQAANLRSKTL